MGKIAIIDPASYALPYDYFYVKSLSSFYKVDFYCSSTKFNYDYVEKLRLLPNVTVHEFQVSGVNKFRGLINYIKLLMKVALSSQKYKAINLQWSLVTFFEVIFFFYVRSKLIVTFHNSVPHNKPRKAYRNIKILAHMANKLLFVSNYTRNDFLDLYGFAKQKCFVLNHGVMPINNEHFHCKIFSSPPRRIVFWGNIKDYKGVDFLLDALPLFKKKGFSLEVYGKFDENKKALAQKLYHNGVKVIDGYLNLDEVEKLLSSNIALILPYKAASQSGVMYTALNYNTIILATNCGDPYEFLKECDLKELSFKYNDLISLEKSLDYLSVNHEIIKERIISSKEKYNWAFPASVLNNIFGSRI
ncbi:TPA: glycosyltransferase family 4 protein [Enterobacter hormaechei subsp. xiangfangensis]|nr:glycosyltransferase family 4 protein [Enterobacter hormaechei]